MRTPLPCPADPANALTRFLKKTAPFSDSKGEQKLMGRPLTSGPPPQQSEPKPIRNPSGAGVYGAGLRQDTPYSTGRAPPSGYGSVMATGASSGA
jgi:hypothetical protein